MLTERSARVAAAVKLHRHIGRRRAGLFLAEGINLVAAAIERGLVRDVFVTEDAARRHEAQLAGGRVPVHLVTDRAAKALSDTVTPTGLVAVCEIPDTQLDDVLAGSPRLVAVAVDISEPGNAGTLIRLADAMGAAAVVLAGHSVDPYNGKCLRASTGSIFAIPVVVAADPHAALTQLRSAGLQVLATRTGSTYYLTVINTGGSAHSATVNLSGVSTVSSTASTTSLSGTSSTSTNSITSPTNIVPVTGTLSGLGTPFTDSFPGYSITVLQFTAS